MFWSDALNCAHLPGTNVDMLTHLATPQTSDVTAGAFTLTADWTHLLWPHTYYSSYFLQCMSLVWALLFQTPGLQVHFPSSPQGDPPGVQCTWRAGRDIWPWCLSVFAQSQHVFPVCFHNDESQVDFTTGLICPENEANILQANSVNMKWTTRS